MPTVTLDRHETRTALQQDSCSITIPDRSTVIASGSDVITMLDAVTTQSLADVLPGHSAPTLFLDRTSAIIAPTVAWRIDDDTIALETLSSTAEALMAHLRKYRLRANVELELRDGGVLLIAGASASPTLHQSGGIAAPLMPLPAWGFPGAAEDPLADMPSGDWTELRALSISSGIPWLEDWLPGRMPAEVGAMRDAVALDKGCYLGQEPVARLHYRGRANRTLRTVTLTDPETSPGTELVSSDRPDKPVGIITACLAFDGNGVGLAIVRREFNTGDVLTVVGNGATAQIGETVRPM